MGSSNVWNGPNMIPLNIQFSGWRPWTIHTIYRRWVLTSSAKSHFFTISSDITVQHQSVCPVVNLHTQCPGIRSVILSVRLTTSSYVLYQPRLIHYTWINRIFCQIFQTHMAKQSLFGQHYGTVPFGVIFRVVCRPSIEFRAVELTCYWTH